MSPDVSAAVERLTEFSAQIVGFSHQLTKSDADDLAADLATILARVAELEAKGRTLADTLRMYGYPVSEAHWRSASGSMSAEARALHLAAESFRALLSKGEPS